MSSENENSPLISKKNDSLSTAGGAISNSSISNPSMRRGRKFLVTRCILVTELCERLTFYGLTANLLLFSSNVLNLDSPWPSTINYLFQGTCYLIPLLGGWLADTYMGRFNTIYASSLLYVVGTLLLALVSMRDDKFKTMFNVKSVLNKTMRLVYFVLSLVMIALGTGGIKANVSPFGADQVQKDGPRAVQAFFNWFYWFINIGSLIAFTVVVWVQQSNGFFPGYCITAGTMILAVITFVAGRNKYLTKPPGGSQLTETAKIIREAVRNRKQNAGTWLEGAKSRFGGKFSEAQVENVKALLRVIAVFIFLFIPYWTVYSQMQTTFLLQATYMNLKISESFTFPAAALSILDIFAVLALIPFMDYVVYPLLSYYGIRFTPLRRIGVGMLFAAASVIVAGVVEIKRRNDGGFHMQTVFDKKYNASSTSIFWQVPQFVLIGSSEVLASITGLEFAYSQAPKSLQGVVMGAFQLTTGLGSYVATLLVVIVQSASMKWYPSQDPNQGHLEYFFFLLAGLMVVNFVVFLYIASSYKYKAAPKRACRW